MVEHANLARLFSATEAWFHFDHTDVWTLFHSSAFDFSVWEMWGALIHGGRLIVVDQFTTRSPGEFYQMLCRSGVTVLNQTPSAFQQLMMAQSESSEAHLLRRVIFGGEALEVGILKDWYHDPRNRRAQLINMYGITETTVHVTYRPLEPSDTERRSSPVGVRIPDMKVYLLDTYGQPAPIGVAGEMYIGGAGVARGYLNRPDLTAERFVIDPFTNQSGARKYKSGDLARYCANGEIEYLGRTDLQVKVRGYRIELGEIEAVLSGHPAVKQAVALAREDEPGEKWLVAYVVLDLEKQAASRRGAGNEADLVGQWQMIFDDNYTRETAGSDPTFNTTGWISSYTGEPIPAEEMKEWLDQTVERIMRLKPRRVLEIGCGSGMILHRVAPLCEEYWATDFSAAAIESVRGALEEAGKDYSQVKLLERTADDFSGIEPNRFDLVILNSVVQYFPTIDYLVRVLRQAVDAVRPGGAIFIGDVRNYRLLEALHSSIRLYQAPPELTVKRLREQIEQQAASEEELLVAPEFFLALKRELGKIGVVQVELKRGRRENELNRFRYDVTLRLGGEGEVERVAPFVDWRKEQLSLEEAGRILKEEKPESLCVMGAPSGRLWQEMRLLELLSSEDVAGSVVELKRELSEFSGSRGVDPEDIWELSEKVGYQAEICWSNGGGLGRFDVLFKQLGDRGVQATMAEITFGDEMEKTGGYGRYANNPVQMEIKSELTTELKRYLKQRLPDYMAPSVIIELRRMPLTSNGKLNRKALPAPMWEGNIHGSEIPDNLNPVEEVLVGIWGELLKRSRIGVKENFFELGGHSLMATRVISRVRATFGVEVRLVDLFTSPTIESFARLVEEAILAKLSPEKLDELLNREERFATAVNEPLSL
jgi:acyl-CoA synthetase (AMP-forming)/AMP-acid ligase II